MLGTPPLARQWLERNHHNRPPSVTLVHTYAKQMTAGRARKGKAGLLKSARPGGAGRGGARPAPAGRGRHGEPGSSSVGVQR